jgi:hypothetical protein
VFKMSRVRWRVSALRATSSYLGGEGEERLPIRVAISGHQCPYAHHSAHQRPSEAIREPLSSHQRANQCPSESHSRHEP